MGARPAFRCERPFANDGLSDPGRKLQDRRQIWRHSGYADKHAIFPRRKKVQDDRRLNRSRRSFQSPRQSTLIKSCTRLATANASHWARVLVTATLLYFPFRRVLICICRESDACLLVVSVLKTVAPTRCVGG